MTSSASVCSQSLVRVFRVDLRSGFTLFLFDCQVSVIALREKNIWIAIVEAACSSFDDSEGIFSSEICQNQKPPPCLDLQKKMADERRSEATRSPCDFPSVFIRFGRVAGGSRARNCGCGFFRIRSAWRGWNCVRFSPREGRIGGPNAQWWGFELELRRACSPFRRFYSDRTKGINIYEIRDARASCGGVRGRACMRTAAEMA